MTADPICLFVDRDSMPLTEQPRGGEARDASSDYGNVQSGPIYQRNDTLGRRGRLTRKGDTSDASQGEQRCSMPVGSLRGDPVDDRERYLLYVCVRSRISAQDCARPGSNGGSSLYEARGQKSVPYHG